MTLFCSLTREQNIKQIISYLTTEHFEYKEEDDEQTKVIFKFPYVISEIISCELDEFNDHLVSKEEYIIQLLSYFTQRDASKTCVNSLLCSYVIKALSTLLTKHYINVCFFFPIIFFWNNHVISPLFFF